VRTAENAKSMERLLVTAAIMTRYRHVSQAVAPDHSDGDWLEQLMLPKDGAILVRPDQHVAARSDQGLKPGALLPIVRVLLGRAPAAAGSANL
jgi:hypothetical protein